MIDGVDVSASGPQQRDVAMAFQNFALYPHMPARENILSPLRARGVPVPEMERRLQETAALLRIEHVLDHFPRALSNGQKQRTALARALIAGPAVLLLDDPLRNVDAKLRYEMRLEIPRLIEKARVAAIYVTQDYREAMALGDKIAVLDSSRIVQHADPTEVYDRPETIDVARLFGDPPINLVPADKLSGLPQFSPGGEIIGSGAAVGELTFGIRPQAFSIRAAGVSGGLDGRIIALTPIHNRLVALVRLHSGPEVLASLGEVGTDLAVGEVSMTVDSAQVLVFDRASGARSERGAAA